MYCLDVVSVEVPIPVNDQAKKLFQVADESRHVNINCRNQRLFQVVIVNQVTKKDPADFKFFYISLVLQLRVKLAKQFLGALVIGRRDTNDQWFSGPEGFINFF